MREEDRHGPPGILMSDRRSPSWYEAALTAQFVFFEAVAPARTRRWAGGFGSGPDGTTSLEVIAEIRGSEVSVETSSLPRAVAASLRRRMIATDLLWHFVIDDNSELELPLSLTIVGYDRVVDVDGSPVAFTGRRVDGVPRWIGVAEHRE